MLLVAALSALVVVGVYEVRGRLAKGRLAPDAPASASEQAAPAARPENSPVSRRDSCLELRHRYLARCPDDLHASVPPSAPIDPSGKPMTREGEERAIADLTRWLKPRPSELGDMAKRCEVRFVIPAITENQPPAVTDEQSSDLSLASGERALLDRTLRDMHAEVRAFAARAVTEGPGHPANASGLTLEEMLADLETRPENGFEDARQKLAQERAGLAPPPKPGTHQRPGERLLRMWTNMGDEFERRLADGLGAERARQLRFSPHAVWTNRFAHSGCRSQP